ncbi:BON domain-containing protein [Paraburkholderia kururiensis]|uniref:BON domain-containing protein n=1 Tax=Paraburkholderia kururiensis TaxID=984307 RepID=A0ABZ0WQP9_9BURK|nr:BON domain-containing protein [Paraburkholderia kururiensis]WQD79661.1 BON domain-containing protein [Paraburkholderia kururiensis]
MKIAPVIRSACVIACAASAACALFAMNVSAQESSAPPAGSETMGQRLDDATITTKVKATLISKNVKSTHIHVKTRNGVVWLTGTVPTSGDRTAAAEAAQGLSGVKVVKNELKVSATD